MTFDDDDYEWFSNTNNYNSWRWSSWIILWFLGMIVGYWLTHVIGWILGVKP
jgi:hypothetical protein